MAGNDERIFGHYVFSQDPDVLYIGLINWNQRPYSSIPLVGGYLIDEDEVDQRFDDLEADLRLARAEAKTAIRKLQITD